MRTTSIGIAAEAGDRPHAELVTKFEAVEPFVMVFLSDVGGIYIHSSDPAALERLARIFDEAAVRLSAHLDADAAAAVNAQAGAA